MLRHPRHPVKSHPGFPLEVRRLEGAGTEHSPMCPHLPGAPVRLLLPGPSGPAEFLYVKVYAL